MTRAQVQAIARDDTEEEKQSERALLFQTEARLRKGIEEHEAEVKTRQSCEAALKKERAEVLELRRRVSALVRLFSL